MSGVNIISQLIIFLVFALTLSFWYLTPLFVLFCGLLLILVWNRNDHFYRLMTKIKWFYFVMLVIYIFNTPGEHIVHWPFSILHPTYEGLREGFTQVLRIATMLAALSLLIMNNTKQSLISGFYYLARPFNWIGLDAERFAARLWLTLHYAELRQLNANIVGTKGTLLQQLNEVFLNAVDNDIDIRFEKPVFNWLDYFLLISLLVMVGNFLGIFK